MSDKKHPLRLFSFPIVATILIGVAVAWFGNITDLWLYVVLVVLEVTFSFDNAVINSKVLGTLNGFWQKIFLTVGIFIAVFVIRFILPVLLVMIATTKGFFSVIDLALHEPNKYAELLHQASPMIEAFGGAFLLMIALFYFMDTSKDIHWLTRIEKHLSRFGNFRGIQVILMLVVSVALYITVNDDYKNIVLVASVLGIVLNVGLVSMSSAFSKKASSNLLTGRKKQLTGSAAFVSFLYLEVLDASFSLDSVVGAFAITTSVLLIVAGLGAGAVWVRSLTIYLLRVGTLAKYRYLEHGAHWAIFALGLIMIIGLYNITIPEWITGSVGLIFIVTAVATSVLEDRLYKNNKV